MKEKPAPHHAYIFVCTNDDCCDGGSPKLIKRLRRRLDEQGLKKRVRVVACNCLGKCDEGPNAILEPGHLWFSGAGKKDVEDLVVAAQAIVTERVRRDDEG